MLPNNSSYNFKGIIDDIRIFNYGLSVEEIENLASSSSDIKDRNWLNLPYTFRLDQNYPNPFNPSTTIQFTIPRKMHVKLIIFDVSGRKISTLIDKTYLPGIHEVSWNASGLASGIYFYCLEAGDFSSTKKMILLK